MSSMVKILESEAINAIRNVRDRLYDGTKMSFDERRDLARKLSWALSQAIEVDADSIKSAE